MRKANWNVIDEQEWDAYIDRQYQRSLQRKEYANKKYGMPSLFRGDPLAQAEDEHADLGFYLDREREWRNDLADRLEVIWLRLSGSARLEIREMITEIRSTSRENSDPSNLKDSSPNL